MTTESKKLWMSLAWLSYCILIGSIMSYFYQSLFWSIAWVLLSLMWLKCVIKNAGDYLWN